MKIEIPYHLISYMEASACGVPACAFRVTEAAMAPRRRYGHDARFEGAERAEVSK